MHEVSLVAELVTECERRASGRPVRFVRIRHASSIPEEALQQAFRMLTAGSSLTDARLVAEPFDVQLHSVCGFNGVLGHDDLVGSSMAVCPACGNVSSTGRTAELELLEIDTAS